MDYFWLRQDHRKPGTCAIEEFSNIPDYVKVLQGNVAALEDMTVLNVLPGQIQDCPDLLDGQLLMVRGVVREVFGLFLPSLEYRDVCLLDPTTQEHVYYEVPLLGAVDCYSNESVANLNASVIQELALDKSKLPQEHIVRLAKVNAQVIVITLATAEAILRRKPVGVQLLPVRII